ncbi:MAG: hypothetical protein OEV24_13650 [Cyclobacteriaceae bacterium]|nr:hypothetical protein [Cyclobacteriaceae bacterium]MDH5249901.1 hypothetical protein [Cyclobacteriaceae bacterium]
MKNCFSLLIMGCLYTCVYGQTVLDGNPTRLRWRQVRTENFKVLFPTGFDQQAQRVANTLEHIRTAEARTLGSVPRKITVILQNQSAVSNGFVSILPRRSEFYTMPPQDYNFLGTNDWLDLLASHEYRHVVQYQHATRGFNKLFYYLFGSSTLAGMSQAAAPQWFWEGDAVAVETAFTHSGRGRIPNFGLVFRTNLLSGRTFNYHKQYLRSYKNNIPNHYVLGYYMVSYLRRKTNDPEIWGKITSRSWRVPFVPFAFSNAIHNKTGLYVTDLYREMADSLKHAWQAESAGLKLTPFHNVTRHSTKAYTDYLYPQAMKDGAIVAMKRGIGDIEQFVLLKEGKVEKQFTPGFINDAGMLSASNSKIVWNEYGFDLRWSVRSYSLIKIYDIDTGMRWVIGGRHTRLSGAALSPDAKQVVTVQSDNAYQNSVLILDVYTGDLVKSFPNPENYFYSMPRWSDDGKKIALLKNTNGGKTISILDVESGLVRDVLPVSHENVGHPVLQGNYLFFNSPVSGIDNVFVLDLGTNLRYQITTSRFGAYNPSISGDGKTIYYNEQTRDGLDVVKIPFDKSSWTLFDRQTISKTPRLYEYLVAQEARPTLLDSVPKQKFPVTKYAKVKGIINPYNWGAYVTNDLTQVNIGITSRDILSTTSITAGYAYDINEGTSLWRAGLSYQGLYPIIDFGVQAGNRQNTVTGFGNSTRFTWQEYTMEGGLRLPLVLTNSRYSRKLTIGNAVGFTKTSSFESTVKNDGNVLYQGPDRITPANDTLLFVHKDQLNDGTLLYNRATFSFYNLLKRSRRDFLSRWGQTLDAEFYNTPYEGDFVGKLFAVRSTFYFPGFAKHHFFYARGAYQESLQGVETNLYTFRNRIPKPRGMSYPADEKFLSLSANYAFPLWYPDIALGPVLNVQRIKANIFFDYGQGQGRQYYYTADLSRAYGFSNDDEYQSVGVETTFDINIMRFLPKFEIGFRSTYRFSNAYNTSGVVFEFLIGNIGF